MVRDRKLMVQALKSINAKDIQEMELAKILVDAADTLTHVDCIISKNISPLAKESGWISVNDRLPESWDKYLCVTIKPYNGSFIRNKELLEFNTDKHWVCDGIVTHWLETPEFPPAPTL